MAKQKEGYAKKYWRFEMFDELKFLPFMYNYLDKQGNLNLESELHYYNNVTKQSDDPDDYVPYLGEIRIGNCEQEFSNGVRLGEANFLFTGAGLDLYFLYKDHIFNYNVYGEEKTNSLAQFYHEWEAEPDQSLKAEAMQKIEEVIKNELEIEKIYNFEYELIYRPC